MTASPVGDDGARPTDGVNRRPVGVLRETGRALRARRWQLGRLAGWSAAESLPALLSGYLVAGAVDEGFLAGRFGTGLAWLGGLALAVLVGAVATGQVYRALGTVVEPFRDELTDRVVRGALRAATTGGTRPESAAVARLTQQVEVVRDSFGGLLMVVRGFLFAAVSALVGLVALAPLVAALVAAPLLAGLAVFAAGLPAMVAHQRRYVRAGEALGEAAATALAGHRDVLACGAQDRVVAEVGSRITAQADAERTVARMTALRSLSLGLGGWAPLAVLMLAAPWLVARGVTAGAVLGALVYISTGLQPALRALVQGVGGGGLRYVVTLERILLTSPSDESADRTGAPADAGRSAVARDAPATSGDAGPTRGSRPSRGMPDDAAHGDTAHGDAALRVRGLTFRYGPRARPVLADFSLTLAPGEHLAVVGPSGAGKSTLAALASGLVRPESGSVEIAGTPVGELPAEQLARLRVLVPQEAYVFSGSLADNLRYLRPDADDAALTAALDALGARPLADRLGGLAAPVAPTTLSAGERQVIAAVRAWLAPAPLAILDEATCHLDPPAEALVEEAFGRRPGALIVVAHRITSALRADRVLVLDGERPMLGEHRDLLGRSATYRELVGYWDDVPASPPAAGSPARSGSA
ncbi:ATP-binding cassette domain-containing protein [Micromonospora sagamiensis]|uniref:ATP-binding cassette subfamily C protein n=1 Tax=Micromonospora sagamiensis TaxID=47875 RepID=A0A562WGV1_9ACTN|nr:ATP-binding cassette domain-containing protein [Micromonospora sagamiensis]TWJ29117.1 ATP-binding cassette subfamily C protein [Micromonospora sagamiensis]BCL17858.1 ABC transporter ATP-binding protein [Micromonospora sagamiensis]